MNPKYPIYIISKGRWQKRQTSKALEIMKVPYKIVVEPQEYEKYSKDGFNKISLQNPIKELSICVII